MPTLCYTALSPFCRKVRMAMDHMQIDYDIFDSADVTRYPGWNPRAEVPILIDGDTTVRNSATILEYLHCRYPDTFSLFPKAPEAFAIAKEWELIADTMIDPIVTNIALWSFAELRPMPTRLRQAAIGDINAIYMKLNQQLKEREFVAGEISVGDVALYPQVYGAQYIGLAIDPEQHANIAIWLERMKKSDIGRADFAEVVKWWKSKDKQDVETDKINWGTYRLEWFLAHGFHEWFLGEIERDGVLWSVGPNNNARNSPLADANL